MGKAAYDRGTKSIRSQIDTELKNKMMKYPEIFQASALNNLIDIKQSAIDRQALEIESLKSELNQIKLQLSEKCRFCDQQAKEIEKLSSLKQYLSHLLADMTRRWDKCSAILNLIKLYVGREKFEEWHNEAKTDHPRLWGDK